MARLVALLLLAIFGFRNVHILKKKRFINKIKSSLRIIIIRIYRGKVEINKKTVEQIKRSKIQFNRMLWHFVNRINQKKNIREILREQIKIIDDEELVFAFH